MGASTDIHSPRAREAVTPAVGGAPMVDLTLPARAASVASARHEVAALAQQLGFSERRVDDLRTVVSEACMNAAVHAYEDLDGEFNVVAAPSEEGLSITVRDRGNGIRPRPAFDSTSARLGLLLIAALASSVEIASRREGGTRVHIRFGREPR
jgi:serine/threonine-protein kinase RsbW